ncbi:hypothetical protein AVJ23_08610 [Pseudoponticoccus marisrubri]|uniref:Bromoperoxidase n=2 Tax=Pseudoponticoccus marisrubri TaxID=1685382 RepID=A0A0W7WKG6_9RHOB|nr:hypothetical protein AVJ23_08610 [Pseudoponticoccus marisrubri]
MACLRVIEGGAAAPVPDRALPRPETPRPGAAELAGNMAEMFAVALMAPVPLEALGDPHHRITGPGRARPALSEVLGALRSLAWFDGAALPDGTLGAAETRRRRLAWNGQGQLTLSTLLASGVRAHALGGPVSRLWRVDHVVGTPQPGAGRPGEDAPMSDWIRWCARHSGAGLALPGRSAAAARPATLGALSAHALAAPPSRPFHNVALSALAKGVPLALEAAGIRGGARLLALMAEAEARAAHVAFGAAGRGDRLARPAVTAARMSVWLAQGERGAAPATHRAAAAELAESAPELLGWMTAAHDGLRRRPRCRPALFLPLAPRDALPAHPADCASHAVVAGALATLLKAMLDTRAPAVLELGPRPGPALDLGIELDRLAADIARARLSAATHRPAENIHDLRTGEAIALQVLRDAVETGNRDTVLELRDFDGRALRLVGHARHVGRGRATLQVDRQAACWPQQAAPPAAHLTAVV